MSLFETEDIHENHVTDPVRGLPSNVKTFVREKYNDGITKPNNLLERIRTAKLIVPHKSQLVSFLQGLREKKFGPARISAGELQLWCEERSEIPTNEDEVFVVAFHIRAESFDVNEQELKIILSTRRLLALCKNSQLLQCDATYKLLWQGFPVLLAGTTDSSRVFHPVLLAVTTGETSEDFKFVFRALHNFHLEWTPTFLLADGSEAITNGFRAVFGEPLARLMCYTFM